VGARIGRIEGEVWREVWGERIGRRETCGKKDEE
jgi:hypothetical protein